MAEGITIALFILLVLGYSGNLISRYLNNRHNEKLKFIENGGDLVELESVTKSKKWPIKLGMILCGISLGIIVGFVLEVIIPTIKNPINYLFSIFLFTGIAFILFYLIDSKNDY